MPADALSSPSKTAQEILLERFYYKGWNKNDDSEMTEILDASVKFRGSFRRKPLRGIPAFLEYMHKAHAALGNHTILLEDVVVQGGKVAVRLTSRGIHRGDFFGIQGSGHEVAWSSAGFFQLNDDRTRITEIWILGDIDGVKHQIGASVETSIGF